MSSLSAEHFPSQFHAIKTSTNTKGSSRACDSCRALKARCSPAADGTSAALLGQCQRCAMGGKNCVFTAPKRTRRKRTDVRVNELEREVKALSGLLSVERRESTQKVDQGRRKVDERDAAIERQSGQFNNPGRAKRSKENSTEEPQRVLLRPASPEYGRNEDRPSSWSDSQFNQEKPTSNPTSFRNPDAIDRGILSMEQAITLFNHYVDDLVPHRPLVVFTPGTSANSIRTHRPILFLAVLAAAAGSLDRHLSAVLNGLILQVYADRIMIRGEKSLELVQAILVTTNWYYAPDSYEELQFYQYLHMAATMALDIGLGVKAKARQVTSGVKQLEYHSTEDRSVLYCESIDGRRTLLACYLCCASISLGFHRPNMFHWTTYMAESLDILETSPDAATTDSCLVAWIKLQRIMDACTTSLRLDDPTIEANLSDPRIQLTLQTCSKQLSDWKRSIPVTIMNKTLSINYNFFTCILHELALYNDYDPEDFKPPYTIQRLPRILHKNSSSISALTPSYVSSIISCLSSAHTLLDTFLIMPISDLRCSPIIVFVRMSYAVILLIKIFVSASVERASLSHVLDPDAVKVEFYLHLLIPWLTEAASGQHCRGAEKFLLVVTKLDEWHRDQQVKGWQEMTMEEEPELIEPLRHLNVGMDKETYSILETFTINTAPQRYATDSQSTSIASAGEVRLHDARVSNDRQSNYHSPSDQKPSDLIPSKFSFKSDNQSTAQQRTETADNSMQLPSGLMGLPFDNFGNPDQFLGYGTLDSELGMEMTGANTLLNAEDTNFNATHSQDDWMLSFIDSTGEASEDWRSSDVGASAGASSR